MTHVSIKDKAATLAFNDNMSKSAGVQNDGMTTSSKAIDTDVIKDRANAEMYLSSTIH